MSAAQAFDGHFLPKKSFGKRTLRECTSRKRENIVLIEVDSDDFGDVIILDVPESFQQKFRKTPKRVISIDDDGGNKSKDGVCDATTSNRCFPASATSSSNSANVDEDCSFVNEVSIPVKLSKSKRTYSGKNISTNQYGLSPDSESCSSESDCSDCELMEGSFGKLREQWEKASLRRRHDTRCGPSDFENQVGTSAHNQPVHNSAEEGQAEHQNSRSCSHNHDRGDFLSESAQKLTEGSKSSQQDSDPMEIDGLCTRVCGNYTSSSDLNMKDGTSAPHCRVHCSAEQSTVENSELSGGRCYFRSSLDRVNDDRFGDSAEKLAKRSKYSQQECADMEKNKVFTGDFSANVGMGPSYQVSDSDHPASFEREQGAVPFVSSYHLSGCGHENEAETSTGVSKIITDRQKIKETDEYKRAMEEEWASRQQQLQHQAEEARRLRNKKKAENMRMMVNERRQKKRLEEIRETRRKDEQNLNLKERYRVEVREELRKLESLCGDMASLLRCLGIHVGGGSYPSANEVQAAYKRACLKFHPDRVSATDLRQQVEAEEKFKLISNMKDKFLSK